MLPGMTLRRSLAAAALMACGGGASLAQVPASFMLPAFDTPDYECDRLRRVTVQRQPLEGKDAYEVVLHDQNGAEYQGDPAGIVGWKADSTVSVVGTFTISSCRSDGPAPVIIAGRRLKFVLNADGRLVYLEGTGTVTQGSITTQLPVVATAAPASPGNKASAAGKRTQARPPARPASR